MEIKKAIKKWNQELKKNLNKNKNENEVLEVFFIPEEWKDENNQNLKNILEKFLKEESISNDNGENVIPDSEFFVMKKEIFVELNFNYKLISTDAEFKENKLIVDLGKGNYYFYYLNTSNDLCEGYIESPKRGKDEEIITQFKNFSPEIFRMFILKEIKPDIKDNQIIYNLNKYKIVFKNDKELIKSINTDNNNEKPNVNKSNKIWGSTQRKDGKQNINNEYNEEDKKNKDLIIRCIIYYYFTKVDINDLIMEKDKKEYNFILIDSDWIKLFIEKYNYNFYERKIKINKIDDKNYFQYLNIFKDINIDKIKQFIIIMN